MLIIFMFGFVLGAYVTKSQNESNEATEHRYKPNVKVIQPIRPTDYLDFEFDQLGLSNLRLDQEAPLFMMKALISNPIYQRYENNTDVRIVIDKAKVDGIITAKEFIEIRRTIRDVYMKTQDKEEQLMLRQLIKSL